MASLLYAALALSRLAEALAALSPGKKALLILGGTVAGVAGMWVSLYKRGKSKKK